MAVCRFFKKTKNKKIELPYDPAILILSTPLEKNMVRKDTSTSALIAALFTIGKTRKQPKCPSTEEWIKMWCVHTYTYHIFIDSFFQFSTHTHTHTEWHIQSVSQFSCSVVSDIATP